MSFHMRPEDFQKQAIGWACATARLRGWTWKREGDMIWVDTGESEVGCSGWMDFVGFVSGH